jgi:hypothetical protein
MLESTRASFVRLRRNLETVQGECKIAIRRNPNMDNAEYSRLVFRSAWADHAITVVAVSLASDSTEPADQWVYAKSKDVQNYENGTHRDSYLDIFHEELATTIRMVADAP